MKVNFVKAVAAKAKSRIAHQAGLIKSKAGKARARFSKAVLALLAGFAMLIVPGGSLAGWLAEATISIETIRTGELSMSQGPETWTLNGTQVSESALSTTPLVPEDLLAYSGTFTLTIEGDMTASLALDNAVATGLATSPVIAIDWGLDGSKATQTLDESDSGSTHTVQWRLQMAPVSDPA